MRQSDFRPSARNTPRHPSLCKPPTPLLQPCLVRRLLCTRTRMTSTPHPSTPKHCPHCRPRSYHSDERIPCRRYRRTSRLASQESPRRRRRHDIPRARQSASLLPETFLPRRTRTPSRRKLLQIRLSRSHPSPRSSHGLANSLQRNSRSSSIDRPLHVLAPRPRPILHTSARADRSAAHRAAFQTARCPLQHSLTVYRKARTPLSTASPRQ